VLFPLLASLSEAPSSNACGLQVVLLRITFELEPLSIALMAVVRWKVVAQQNNEKSAKPVNVNRWIGGCLLLVLIYVAVDTAHVWTAGLVPFWAIFYLCVQSDLWYLIGNIILFVVAAPFVVYYTYKLAKFVSGHADQGTSQTRRAKQAVNVVTALTISYYSCHLPWYLTIITSIGFSPVNWINYRYLICVYVLHASFNPLISILMITRNRNKAKQILMSIPGVTRLVEWTSIGTNLSASGKSGKSGKKPWEGTEATDATDSDVRLDSRNKSEFVVSKNTIPNEESAVEPQTV
jgi:hypothetical protein